MKTDTAKYYPEIHVILADGTIMATISPNQKSNANFGSSMYVDNFRDDRLKINDDRKVRLTLSDFKDRRDMMIILTVRVNDIKGKSVNKDAYKQAWYRLQNEDTNQTLDYIYIDKVKKEAGIEDEDGEEEAEEVDEDEENAPPTKKETIFLAGRLYREDTEIKNKGAPTPKEGETVDNKDKKYKTKWIYERWNKIVNTAEYPNLPITLGEVLRSTRE